MQSLDFVIDAFSVITVAVKICSVHPNIMESISHNGMTITTRFKLKVKRMLVVALRT